MHSSGLTREGLQASRPPGPQASSTSFARYFKHQPAITPATKATDRWNLTPLACEPWSVFEVEEPQAAGQGSARQGLDCGDLLSLSGLLLLGSCALFAGRVCDFALAGLILSASYWFNVASPGCRLPEAAVSRAWALDPESRHCRGFTRENATSRPSGQAAPNSCCAPVLYPCPAFRSWMNREFVRSTGSPPAQSQTRRTRGRAHS